MLKVLKVLKVLKDESSDSEPSHGEQDLGSCSPLAMRRILILHQEEGSRGLSGPAVRLP